LGEDVRIIWDFQVWRIAKTNFETSASNIIAELDRQCRLQQLNGSWFLDITGVQLRAISMSIRQILIVAIPGVRKAKAARAAVEGPPGNICSGSILRAHDEANLFLDRESARLWDREKLAAATLGELS